jgi:transposase
MARLRPYFPKSRGRAHVDDQRVLSGIIFINRNGLRWSDAPAAYGPPKTLYNRWKRWSDMGVFARIMMGLIFSAHCTDDCYARRGCR